MAFHFGPPYRSVLSSIEVSLHLQQRPTTTILAKDPEILKEFLFSRGKYFEYRRAPSRVEREKNKKDDVNIHQRAVIQYYCTHGTMVLAVLIAFGTVTGASEGLKASQSKARREEHRSRKNNLIVHVVKSSEHTNVLEGRRIVLSGDKVRATRERIEFPSH